MIHSFLCTKELLLIFAKSLVVSLNDPVVLHHDRSMYLKEDNERDKDLFEIESDSDCLYSSIWLDDLLGVHPLLISFINIVRIYCYLGLVCKRLKVLKLLSPNFEIDTEIISPSDFEDRIFSLCIEECHGNPIIVEAKLLEIFMINQWFLNFLSVEQISYWWLIWFD